MNQSLRKTKYEKTGYQWWKHLLQTYLFMSSVLIHYFIITDQEKDVTVCFKFIYLILFPPHVKNKKRVETNKLIKKYIK